jgi:hypothetical protein
MLALGAAASLVTRKRFMQAGGPNFAGVMVHVYLGTHHRQPNLAQSSSSFQETSLNKGHHRNLE